MFSVFRTPWKRCCFSGDGEYIVAGSARQHALYIWEKSIGNLVKILHGTRGELLLDVAVRMSNLKFWLSITLCRDLSTDTTLLQAYFILCYVNQVIYPFYLWPLFSGILSVRLSPPSPVELCPSGLRTKWWVDGDSKGWMNMVTDGTFQCQSLFLI